LGFPGSRRWGEHGFHRRDRIHHDRGESLRHEDTQQVGNAKGMSCIRLFVCIDFVKSVVIEPKKCMEKKMLSFISITHIFTKISQKSIKGK
jgi:hypothetical protein